MCVKEAYTGGVHACAEASDGDVQLRLHLRLPRVPALVSRCPGVQCARCALALASSEVQRAQGCVRMQEGYKTVAGKVHKVIERGMHARGDPRQSWGPARKQQQGDAIDRDQSALIN